MVARRRRIVPSSSTTRIRLGVTLLWDASTVPKRSLNIAATDGAAALGLTATCEYAVIVLDLMMPRLNGFEFLEAFRTASPAARSVIFVITAFDDSMVGPLAAHQVHAIIRNRSRSP